MTVGAIASLYWAANVSNMSIFAPVKQSGKKNIADLQRLINLTGHDRVAVDGIMGSQTMGALNTLPGPAQALVDQFAKTRQVAYPRISMASPPNVQSKDLVQKVRDAAKELGINPKFAVAVVNIESDFNPDAVSPTGAVGLFQLTTPAIVDVGNHYPNLATPPNGDKKNVDWNIAVGLRYLRLCFKRLGHNPRTRNVAAFTDVYAAYNIGIGNFRKLMAGKFEDKTLQQTIAGQASYLSAGGVGNYLPSVQSRLESLLT